MKTKDSFEQTKRAVYRELVRKDCYMMTAWPCDFFDYIIDIGANVGVFTTYAHMRHPKAKIFAYEPCKETYDYVVNSSSYMDDNVEFINEALGDGSLLTFVDIGWSGQNQFFKKNEKENMVDNYTIESKSLNSIFQEKSIPLDSKYFIKMDCEGGERFLLDDKESISIIKKSCCCSIEVHFPPRGKNPRKDSAERFNSFPQWEEYDEWFHNTFEETHKVIYHCSSGRVGNGVYVLLKKENM